MVMHTAYESLKLQILAVDSDSFFRVAGNIGLIACSKSVASKITDPCSAGPEVLVLARRN